MLYICIHNCRTDYKQRKSLQPYVLALLARNAGRSSILGAGLMETTTTVMKRATLQEVGASTEEGGGRRGLGGGGRRDGSGGGGGVMQVCMPIIFPAPCFSLGWRVGSSTRLLEERAWGFTRYEVSVQLRRHLLEGRIIIV